MFKDRIKKLRTEKHMSQVSLAFETDLNQETISSYEREKSVPPADNLVKFADFFNTSVDYLLCRTDVRSFEQLHKSDLNEPEQEVLRNFRKLNNENRAKAVEMLKILGK